MDPETYVFPKINSVPRKIAASTLVFVIAMVAASLLLSRLPGPRLWAAVDLPITAGPVTTSLASLLHLLFGYALFIYASYHAWRATREKNSVEDPLRQTATCLLTDGYYARVRHPMYGMFALADVGLGFALKSVYGLGFALLFLGLFLLNGIFEERSSLIPMFGDQYRAYMQQVRARYFSLPQTGVLVLSLAIYIVGIFYR